MARKKIATIATYTYEDTSDKNIKRFADQRGDWTHYYLVKEKKYVPAVSHLLSLGYSKGPRFRAYLESHTKEEIKQTLDRAGDRGARVHAAIRDLISGVQVTMTTKYPSDLQRGRQEPLNEDEWEYLLTFERWCATYQPRLIGQEETHTDGESAGTYDALLIITVPSGDKYFPKIAWGQDVLFLPDWKTSSGIWNEYRAQLAAYWSFVRFDKRYAKFIEAYRGRIYTGIVRLGTAHKIGYDLEVWDQRATEGENYKEYRAAITIAHGHEPKFDPTIEQIPTEILIKVPSAVVRPKRALLKKKK